MANIPPFHLAFPVTDLAKAREFYCRVLGCSEGRSSDTWVDFNLYGHQIVAHLRKDEKGKREINNPVDGHDVPVPHFGLVLEWSEWERLAQKLKTNKVDFIIEPYVRFKDKAGEQGTLFIRDPSGNALEFKAFKDTNQLFAK